MQNNDVLRSLRFILNVSDAKLAEIFGLAGLKVPTAAVTSFLKKDDEVGYLECEDETMALFLNGLIFLKRGKDESRPPMPIEVPITNNIVLKKLRVAFNLKEDDILELLAKNDFPVGRSELSAFFRRRDHSNYRNCGDQFLRNFLKGLASLQRAT